MITLSKTKRYQAARDIFIKNNLQRGNLLIKILSLFVQNPLHPSLNLEKLKGTKIWTIRIDKGNRIFFMWVDKQTVLLIDIGPHDKYRRY